MLFYNGDYQKTYYFRKSSVMELSWWESSRNMSDVAFMEELIAFIDYAERYKPNYLLVNLEKMFYHIHKDLIPFTSMKLQKLNQCGLRRVALIESDDSITQVLMHKIMEYSKHINFEVQFFKNEDKAIEWLKLDENIRKAFTGKSHFYKVA